MKLNAQIKERLGLFQVNVCQTTQCKGSVMNPTHMTVDPRTWQRPIEETQRLAKDFIDQYFESTKR